MTVVWKAALMVVKSVVWRAVVRVAVMAVKSVGKRDATD